MVSRDGHVLGPDPGTPTRADPTLTASHASVLFLGPVRLRRARCWCQDPGPPVPLRWYISAARGSKGARGVIGVGGKEKYLAVIDIMPYGSIKQSAYDPIFPCLASLARPVCLGVDPLVGAEVGGGFARGSMVVPCM